jgi:hypothetical protein
MSTKATIFLTEDNEHCYEEVIDDTIIMEFSKDNIKIICDDELDLIIEIKKGSELYKLIKNYKK